MKIKKNIIATAIALGLFGHVAHAEMAAQPVGAKPGTAAVVAHAQQSASNTELKEAEAKLKATFSQLNVTSFGPSPLPGIYEIQAGSNIMYFAPENAEHEGIILLGEMYNKDGVSLTERSKDRLLSKTIKTLDLSSAVSVGQVNAPAYYEITDPDCPYCHAYDAWRKDIDKDGALHRKLLFMVNPGHPLAKAKIEHIICSDNKDEAVKYTFSDALPHESLDSASPLQLANYKSLKTCPEAAGIIDQHQKIIASLGVNGTPSFVFGADTDNPVKVVGFAKDKILENILKVKSTTTTTAK
ncbi:thiol:disulfide interchange protein DsbC [Rahnella inusitata]|nr:thiol:disulfide interchange protein DsbC [Rahnella inusitata]